MNKSIEEIVEFLIDKKLTITTAESCTGGLIASAIVDIPGVSEIFTRDMLPIPMRQKNAC